MTPEMIERARRNAAKGVDGKPYSNVEFHLAMIDKLPVPAGSVDCVISNCVINLAPDKQAVFREIARVLKPGGRLAVSDIALKKQLPPEVSSDLLAYVGCVEISPHAADTVYLAATRYKLADYRPYLFRSTDGGRSFQSVNGDFPENEITRVVRADPKIVTR